MISIIVSFSGLLGSMLIYGPMLLNNIEISANHTDNSSSNTKIIEMTIICLISGVANPIGGFITEIEFFGRRRSCAMASLLGAFSAIMIIINPTTKLLFTSVLCFSSFLFINIFSSYILEIFPTKFRSMAISLFYANMRIGGFISQFLFVFCYKLDHIFPYYMYSMFFTIIVGLLYLLPYDTSGRPLD